MFSSITMASSTTKPIERISAIIDRLFRLKSSSYITANVPRMENGSAIAGIIVAETLCRNRKITPTTSTSVTSIVNWMSVNASRMFFERSCRGVRCTDGRQLRLERRQQRADGVGHFDGVAARLPHHLQRDGALRRRLPSVVF